jgi:glycosyltransferase involved in cell wall biosynthesis
MLQDRNVLCISNPSWEGDYAKTIVELMSVFAQDNKVLYVDNPFTIKDILQAIFKRKALPFRKVFGLVSRITKINLDNKGSVYVLTPPVTLTINFLPEGKLYDLLLKFNGWMVTRSIQKSLRKLNMTDRLINIVAFNPSLGVVCGRKFNESLLIYHCYDQIEAANWLKKHGPSLERKMMKIADAVIVTSQGLFEEKKAFSTRCYLVKNGVNFGLFSKAFSKHSPEMEKVVGYIGSIDDRLDYELLEWLVAALPGIRFDFVGRIVDEKAASGLKKYQNVIFHGSRKVQELPEYLKHFSLGIIPFAKNRFTKGIYPLKINEYLAAGIPVVTTDFGWLEDFRKTVSIAGTREEFKTAVLDGISLDDDSKRAERQEAASENSWDHRAREISAIISSLENQLN